MSFNPAATKPLQNVFKSNDSYHPFAGFFKRILTQVPEEKVAGIRENIFNVLKENNYNQAVEEMQKISPKGLSRVWKNISALSELKKELSLQIKTFFFPKERFNGYLEIGYPAARMLTTIQKHVAVDGPVYILNEEEGSGIAKAIEEGRVIPQKSSYIPLTYESISEKECPTASIGLASCFIGLHHCPPDKLDAFVASLKRVIKPGGSLLLMDHDIKNENVAAYAQGAHSLFNAYFGVPAQDEASEVRNFQALEYWIKVLEKHGFQVSTAPGQIRHGDPTLNTLMRFYRKPETEEELLEVAKNNPHKKSLNEGFLRWIEWYNVAQAQEMGPFLETNPLSSYPFFTTAKNTAKLFYQSVKTAVQKTSVKEVISDPNFSTSCFIASIMVTENLAKGIFLTPAKALKKFSSLFPQVNFVNYSESSTKFAEIHKEYGEFLNHTPFPFFDWSTHKGYWKVLSNELKQNISKQGLLKTVFSPSTAAHIAQGVFLSTDFTIKNIGCSFLRSSMQLEDTPLYTDFVVRSSKKAEDLNLGDLQTLYTLEDSGLQIWRSKQHLPGNNALKSMLTDESIEVVQACGQKNLSVRLKGTSKEEGTFSYPHIHGQEPSHIKTSVNLKDLQAMLKTNPENIEYIYNV